MPDWSKSAPKAVVVPAKTRMTTAKIEQLEKDGIVYEGKQYYTDKEKEQQKFEDYKFGNAMKNWSIKQHKFDEEFVKAYGWIHSKHLSETMQERLESHSEFTSKIKNNLLELMRAVKAIMMKPNEH